VIDRPEEVLVRAAVPGYKKEEIEISVSNGTLTIYESPQAAIDGSSDCAESSRP